VRSSFFLVFILGCFLYAPASLLQDLLSVRISFLRSFLCGFDSSDLSAFLHIVFLCCFYAAALLISRKANPSDASAVHDIYLIL
jgi:hypothetical protein